jgi:hypothetical protein
MLLAEASSAICVQRFDDSRNSAIHTTYRISLRSSSLREPRYPLLRVVSVRMNWPGQFIIVRLDKGLGLVLMVSKGPTSHQASISNPFLDCHTQDRMMVRADQSMIAHQPISSHWEASEGP